MPIINGEADVNTLGSVMVGVKVVVTVVLVMVLTVGDQGQVQVNRFIVG